MLCSFMVIINNQVNVSLIMELSICIKSKLNMQEFGKNCNKQSSTLGQYLFVTTKHNQKLYL